MTPQRGEAGRGPGASRAEAPAAPGATLPILFLGALLLRVVIAYVLFPGAGFETDVNAYQSWAVTLARYGPDGFYQHAGFVDYAPGYLYILWLVGSVAQALGSLTGASPFTFTPLLVKLPAIVFDLALGALIYAALRRWSGQRVAIVGAALYLFNPVTWYESALWGQVDAVGTFVLLAAVLLLVAGWSEGAAGAAVAAALIKPQYAIVLFVVGCVLLGRHLVAPGSGPVVHLRHPLLVRLNDALGGWFTAEQGPWRLVSSAAVGLIVLFLVITPFDLAQYAAQKAPALAVGGDLGGLAVVYGQAAGQYHYLTLNAYNPWALVGPQSLAATWRWNAQSDLEPAIGPIPWFAIGAFLLAIGLVYLGYRLIRRTDRTSIIVTATVLAVAFFILPTRVHERYLFPAFALGALVAARSSAWRWWYVLLAGANIVNQHAVLTHPLFATPNVENLALGELFRSEPVVIFVSLAHTALFGWALWKIRPAARDLPSPEERARGPDARAPAPPAPGLALATSPADAGPGAAGPSAPDDPASEIPWREVGFETPDWWRSLRERLTVPSMRPDRSVLLHGEPGGRMDRVDLVAVLLILVVGLSLRGFRADQPFAMVTLDEIYHARTATEFLQDWRYGMPHAIYEYTHPHLAKYLMAVGIVALGNDRVVATSDLGTPVRGVAVERAYVSAERPGKRSGDRLFVATGDAVRVLDLRSNADEARVPVAATAVALEPSEHELYAGDREGTIWSLATSLLDRWRDAGGGVEDFDAVAVAHVGVAIDRLWAVSGDRLVVASGDELLSVDASSGRVLARRAGLAIGAAVALDTVATAVVHPESVGSIADEARTLADLLGLDAAELEDRLSSSSPDPVAGVRVLTRLTAEQRGDVQAAIDDGTLAGTEIVDRAPLVAAVRSGLAVVDTTSLETVEQVPLDAPALGLDRVGEGGDKRLYVARADEHVQIVRIDASSGTLSVGEALAMPGAVRDVRWNAATNLVHVLGTAPSGEPTVYVIETHGNAVFADARLAFEPVAWVLDVQPDRPSADRQRGLAFAADGRAATIDVGRNAFAWRLPGVLFGVLMAAAIYLLARILFRRRAVAILATAAMLTDGMLFAHSRDAMNDAYVGFFIVAALTVLAWLWMGDRPRHPLAVAVGLPVVGVLLGLALASKWVAIFAIGAAILLVLLRSAVGRLVALAGMVVLAGILGNLALATGNLAFALIMLGLTLLMAAGLAWRPQVFSQEELRFAAAAPAAVGVVALATTATGLVPDGSVAILGIELSLVPAGLVLVGAGLATWLAIRVALRFGWIRALGVPGRAVESAEDAPAPPPPGWLRPGAGWGVATGYALLCLAIVPVVVYVASYVPWARPWDDACPLPTNNCPQILPASIAPGGAVRAEGWPRGHRGQTLWDLTRGMYDYHNDLRATHPAGSPWWAWPFDLKPVWLYQDPHGGAGTTAVIFDTGNMVTFWLAVPAIGFGLWQAWRRRSLALGFVAISFLALWLGWARVDRVSYQYHYYTALPFAFVFLGYFLAELWHGPSPRTWLLMRVAAAAAMVAPGAMWLLKDPLCTLAGVTTVSPTSYLCTSQSGSLSIPIATAVISGVLVIALALIARELLLLGRSGPARASRGGSLHVGAAGGAVARLAAILAALGIAVTVIPRLVGGGSFALTGSLGQVWVVGALLAAVGLLFGWLVLGARDPRRTVVAVVAAAAFWFVLFYPYIADLPLPANTPYLYQRILPTFDYSFQFAVNQAPSPDVGFLDPQGFVLVASIGAAAFVMLLLVRQWRLDRLAFEAPADGAEAVPPSS